MTNRKNIVELSVDKITNKYHGFEGILIDSFIIKENDPEIKKKIDSFLELKKLGNCLMLHVVPVTQRLPFFLQNHLVQLGYDVGFFGDASLYSSIFNEVLFGNVDELIAYLNQLNEYFLFPNKTIAQKYIMTHDKMSAQNEDIEDIVDMMIYEIWEHKDEK